MAAELVALVDTSRFSYLLATRWRVSSSAQCGVTVTPAWLHAKPAFACSVGGWAVRRREDSLQTGRGVDGHAVLLRERTPTWSKEHRWRSSTSAATEAGAFGS